jgi:hypothetical protein
MRTVEIAIVLAAPPLTYVWKRCCPESEWAELLHRCSLVVGVGGLGFLTGVVLLTRIAVAK